MNRSFENNSSLKKDNVSNAIHRNDQQNFRLEKKNNWSNGLVILNELDTSDDDSSSSSSSSSYTSEISNSTTHNSALFSNSPTYYNSKITNSYSASISRSQQNQEETCLYSDPKNVLETSNTENNSSNSSCNSKLSKSTTTSNFSMEQEDQDRESSRSDDTDSPVGPPIEKKLLPMPQTNTSHVPNYVNVSKDVNISNTLSDANEEQDDIKSGKMIGANLSDEETVNENTRVAYNRNDRDNHQSR